ncbi:MAG TPA: type I secretion system permease/ATPase [Burkholderiales bacterium]|nr:type I secretion system permease/ATPase [Burkholderiales bacterium]
MRDLVSRFRPLFVFAGLFSLVINLLLLVPPLYMLQVFDRVLTSRSGETLFVLTVAAVAALGFMAMLDVLRTRLLAAAGAALDRGLGPRVLDGLLAQTARLSGAAYLNGLRDVNTLRGFLGGNGLLTLFDAPWLPFFLLVIFLFHPLLGAIALAGALFMVLLAWLNERLTREPLERAQTEARRAARFIDANVRNAEVVSALGMLPAVTRRWARLNDAALGEQARAARAGSFFSGSTKFARQFIQLAMLAGGAYLVVAEHVTAGVMIAATILLGRALAPVETLVGGWRGLVEARSAWRRLDQLLKDSPQLEPGTELPAPLGRLEVERVVFGLGDKPILRGVSFKLEPGEALGLIGPSASGKSTLARLIVGVWKARAGVVRLDGADVATWPRERLGPHIGYLPQDVELFAGTVAENIARLGEPADAEVIRAAQRAQVHEMILRLPKGYDTEIGEGGQSLSPGQRQRIALARALYGNPRLVVLDEPNADLDSEGEEALLGALQGLKADGVTLVIIAHRPSMLRGVDKMLVLRDGLVDRFGPRGEIMERVARQAA